MHLVTYLWIQSLFKQYKLANSSVSEAGIALGMRAWSQEHRYLSSPSSKPHDPALLLNFFYVTVPVFRKDNTLPSLSRLCWKWADSHTHLHPSRWGITPDTGLLFSWLQTVVRAQAMESGRLCSATWQLCKALCTLGKSGHLHGSSWRGEAPSQCLLTHRLEDGRWNLQVCFPSFESSLQSVLPCILAFSICCKELTAIASFPQQPNHICPSNPRFPRAHPSRL